MTTTTTARVGIITARTATVSGVDVEVYTHHVDPRCGRTDDRVVEVGVTARDAEHASMECDYCHAEADHVDRYPGENDLDRTVEYGMGTRRAAATKPVRTNRYAGKCRNCSAWVEAETGLLVGTPGAWAVEHRAGECVEAPAPVVVAPAAPRSEPVEGIHRISGDRVVKVQRGRESGNLYAKLLVVTDNGDGTHDGEFLYAPGLIVECSTETAMSLDEARSYGALYNICCVCGARLSDEVSVALGIGPVCGGRVYEWSTGRVLTVAQVRLLARLVDGPVPVGRSARTANALAGHGLARLVDVDGVASVEAVA